MKRVRRSQDSSDKEGSDADNAEKFYSEESDSHESGSENGDVGEEGPAAVISSAPQPLPRVSAGESAANHATDAEISELANDIMELSGEEAEQNDRDCDENPRRSASPANSLTGITIDHGAIVDEDFPAYFRKDIEKVSRFLRNLETQKCDISEKTHRDRRATITIPQRHVRTLDGVGKCLQLIPEGSMSRYTQPYEGFPWVFVSRCVGVGIPPHIMRVLFFFYRLQRHISSNGMSMYVVPTPNLRLKISRHNKHVEFVYEVVERNVVEPNQSDDEGAAGTSRHFLLGHAMRKRSRQNDGESFKQRAAFSIRVAFTGAFFKEEGVAKQALFCTAIITPVRNFDMLSYITGNFLVQPKTTPQNSKYNDWNDLNFIWGKLLQYEAAKNCGLNGDPCENMIEPGGELGVFTLTSLLTVPLRIADVIRRKYRGVSDIQILGAPKLSYRNDEDMDQYMRYTDEYINEHSRSHEQLMADIATYNKAEQKDRGDMEFLVASPGGWPLKSVPIEGDSRRMFVRFGIFPFPIMMGFKVFRFMSEIVSMDSFQMNIGVLPKSVSKKARDFLTCEATIEEEGADDDFEVPDEDDDHILTEREVATPLVISERFYSKTSVIGQELKTTGMMLTWYHAMTHKMQEDRRGGRVTPLGAMNVVMGHMRQCLENHIGVMASGGYRSFHLEQGMDMVERVRDTPLKDVLLKDYVSHIRRTKVDQRIRHDPYLSMSSAFSLAYCDINRDWVLSAPNLECLMEVQYSAVHYLLGSHSSFVSFFQGVMIMNARGHLNLQDKEGVMMDWRKPNSSGAGFIQERINEFAKLLGVKFNIMPAVNTMIMGQMNRMTDGALEGASCVQIIQGEVVGNPPKELNDQPMMMTEARNNSWGSWIRLGFKRDSNDATYTISTVDPNKTNLRESKLMFQVTNLQICLVATNVKHAGEEPQTISVVVHVVAPGAPAYKKIKDSGGGDAHEVHCEVNDGRAKNPDDGPRQLYLLKLLGFTRIFTGIMVALTHRSGMFPFHVSSVTSAFLDWLFVYVKEHVLCLFNVRVKESFGRMKQGYESRHVVGAVWMKSIMAYMEAEEDCTQAAMRAALSCAHDALPLTEAVSSVHSLLVRGIHSGLVSISGCLIQALHVPIIPIEALCDFFKSDQDMDNNDADVPTPEEAVLDDAVSSASTSSSASSDEAGSDGGAPVAPAVDVEADAGSMGAIPEEEAPAPAAAGVSETPPQGVASTPAPPAIEVSETPALQPQGVPGTPAALWVDEVERVEAPTQPVQQLSFRKGGLPPPPEPVRRSVPPPASGAKVSAAPPYRLDAVEQKVRQLEDVMSRFQLLLDVREQAIGRLDDEAQRLSAFQGKSKNIVNELRTQMSAMMKLVGQLAGPERVSLALHEESAQARAENAFRGKPDSARFKPGGGGGDTDPGRFRQGGGGGDTDPGRFRQDAGFRQGGGPGPDYGGQQWGRGGGGRAPGQRGGGYGRNGGGRGGRRVYDVNGPGNPQ